tara:strand:+ start:12213 stop:13106 length:894 start_codon:yes stop_codon:yes gene_type:complete
MKIIYNPIFLEHNQGNDHPENPERIESLVSELESHEGYYNAIKARNGHKFLELAHSLEYIQEVIQESISEGSLAPDTPLDENSYDVACYAVGASIMAAKLALQGENAFALVRPPGHHAHADWSHEFCVFNNMAIAAIYLQSKGKRVAIIDVDAHLGDGTADIINSFDDILYISSHQDGIFPRDEYDDGINEALAPETSGEEFIQSHWKRMLRRVGEFKPDIIGLSLGTDAHGEDNIEGRIKGVDLRFAYETYQEIKQDIEDLGLPYFIILEGGYNPEVLTECFHFLRENSKVSSSTA